MPANERGAAPIAYAIVLSTGATSAIAAAVLWAQTLPEVASGSNDLNTTLVSIIAAALTSMTGLIAWIGRRVFSGQLVPVELANVTKALEECTEALRESHEREKKLWAKAFPNDG